MLVATLVALAATATPPHIVFCLVDDLGYNGVGFHNPDVKTPMIDALAAEGVRLEGFYTYKVCAPARASFLTGRFPFKLAATRSNFAYFWTLEGTNLSYTMFPKKLQAVGYATHMVGKWHQGFYAPEFLPTARGFDTYFGFLSGCEDHVSQDNCCAPCNVTEYGIGPVIDLYGNGVPALGWNGTNNGFTFTEHAVGLIRNHSAAAPNKPFFLYLALHNTHAPFEVPAVYASQFNYRVPLRTTWSGMVSMVDDTVRNVTTALKEADMWANVLWVMAGDNGSPTAGWGAAGTNAPLRGSKASNWEGGVHTFAFLAGGFLPQHTRGTVRSGPVHICDFYKTFVTLGGGDPVDSGGPSPQDSLDVSGYILGTETASPRSVIVHDHFLTGATPPNSATGAIRIGDWKLLVGKQSFATWFGEFSPNATFNQSAAGVTACDDKPCLFNIAQDPTEHYDVASTQPAKVQELLAEFAKLNSEFHPGNPAGGDRPGYCAAAAKNLGFMVPWRSAPIAAETEPAEAYGDPMLLHGNEKDAASDESWLDAFVSGGARHV